jgi:DNA-directed RNA polymerase specialized sigma24 family protein
MDLDHPSPSGPGRDIDQDALMREMASLRTYLLFIAGKLEHAGSLPGRGVSDLVDSVLCDVFALVRDDDDRFSCLSHQQLKDRLVRRLRWTYWDCLRGRHTYERILEGLPPAPSPRTPSSEIAGQEQGALMAQAQAMLDPADRQLIAWREDECLTYEEIGRRRGYSTPYARRAYLDALERLRSRYLSLGGSPPS